MIAGSENLNGAASSLTDRSGSAASRITSARRVGSDSAAKVRSRAGSKNLTIWFSIRPPAGLSTASSLRGAAKGRETSAIHLYVACGIGTNIDVSA
jgi:hypothetical protein